MSDDYTRRLTDIIAAQADRIIALQARLDAVRNLHKADTALVLAPACATGACTCEYLCPTTPTHVCQGCSRISQEATRWPREDVPSYPCPTVKAADGH